MASPAGQLDQLIASTFEQVRPVFADQITKSTALLAALDMKSKVTIDGGRNLVRPVMYALNGTVGSYDGYDTVNTTPQGGFGEAIYTWKQYAGSVTIDGKTERINAGASAIIKLLQAKFDQLKLSLEKGLNDMLWSDGTGNGGKDFLGMQAVVTDSGTLGGIDSSTETWWKSVAKGTDGSVAGADLTTSAGIKSLNNAFNSVGINKSRVDYEFTTQAVYEAYEGLAQQNIRFTQTKMADLGFEAIAHKTAELVFEAAVPVGTGTGTGGWLYMVNSDCLEFVQHPSAWFKMTDFVRPANQDARTALVLLMGNLITNCRRGNGVIRYVKVT